MRFAPLVAALLILVGVGFAQSAEYESLLEKGEFFLEKGTAYAPDAVRTLEQVLEQNFERAWKDPRFVVTIARAYTRVHRLSEAFNWISRFERQAEPTAQIEALKDFLLNEAGVGRLRLSAAIPTAGVTAKFEPTGETRIDVTGRKILDKLNRWIIRPFELGPDGVTLLVPEGEYLLSSNMALTSDGTTATKIEVWAGDELEQHIVAPYPDAELWQIVAGNRTVELSWPKTERANYLLVRQIEDEEPLVVYEGKEPGFTDTGLLVGVAISYTLETLGPDGSVWAVGGVDTMALPPVSQVWGGVSFDGDLHSTLWWGTDEGTLDRLVIIREGKKSVKTLVDLSGDEMVRNGELRDGPILPTKSEQEFVYKVQAWVDGEAEPAEFSAELVVPPEVAEVDAVSEEITSDKIFIEWGTNPVDAVAQGYSIYLMRSPLDIGELVGKVEDAHAREFSYVPTGNMSPSAQWRHIVIPYVGERFLVQPEPVVLKTKAPGDLTIEKRYERARRRGAKLPNVMLSWDPHPNARNYLVKRIGAAGSEGTNEWVVKTPNLDYLELSGLQTILMGTGHRLEVSAVLYTGEVVLIMSLDLNYQHYLRK